MKVELNLNGLSSVTGEDWGDAAAKGLSALSKEVADLKKQVNLLTDMLRQVDRAHYKLGKDYEKLNAKVSQLSEDVAELTGDCTLNNFI